MKCATFVLALILSASALWAQGLAPAAAKDAPAPATSDAPTARPAAPEGGPATSAPAVKEEGPLAGQTIGLSGNRRATVVKSEGLPFVENEYSRLFTWERYESPKLRLLREKYKLDEVVAPGKTEFEKQVLLMTWAKSCFPFGSPPQGKDGLRNALEILDDAAKPGVKFFCVQYSSVFGAAAQALGWPTRQMAIPQHSFPEVWSNQYGKWVMLDPTPCAYAEKNGVPLNSFEIRHEWFRSDRKALTWVLAKPGKPSERRPAADSDKAPISVVRYYVLGYVPNADWLDSAPDWGRMFITKDDLAAEKPKWHTRKNPADPANEPYFPLNQATMTLLPGGPDLRVVLRTLTPNFKEFQTRASADGPWQSAGDGTNVTWRLKAGRQTFQARSVNKFDVAGPVSTVEIEVQ